ncbi:ATP-binding protein [Ramlibacter sp. PS3R-8]|uniref:hybrid sensor histidine kinase/response regulator n=1 Tax=Ramlibacter sp. PS3R-8 TaxID=3133437 RepID=UPI0030B414A1
MHLDPRLSFLSGPSVMAQLMRDKDWSDSAVGPPQEWPQALRSVVNLLLGSAFPMFVAWGPQLAQLYNDAYLEIMGAKHPGGLGRPLLENWAEIRQDVGPLAEQAMQGHSRYLENLPLRMRRGRGEGEEDTWFTFSYSPVQDESGAVAGMFCACIETTRTVLAERDLRARSEWLQTLFDQAPGFAAVLRGPEHVFAQVNEAYRNLVGGRDLIGRSVADALPEVVNQGFVGWLDAVYRTGEPFIGRAVPAVISRSTGEPPYEAFIDFMYQPLRDAAGRVDGIFVQGHDVTEQHRSREALRQADRQKDEFLATLAHELRNPLAPIRSATYLLRSPAAPAEARNRATEILARQVDHMARLLDDLMDISRITQRRLVLKRERLTVAAAVESALEAGRPLLEAKRHRLQTNVVDPDACLDADPLRLTQVLSNLLNNASKYTDPGGRIAVDARQSGDSIVFTVSDTGIGLSESAIRTMFTMFAQEQTALERSEGGLGIGLALAKGLVELHGGRISASSEGPGLGSRFVVELPAAPAPVAATAASPAAASAAARPRTVLLADDNSDAAEALAELLRLEGHVVHTAAHGLQAAEMAVALRPDVIVLDIGMPGLNGYEVAQRIRAQAWGAKPLLVAATGWGQEGDRQKATAAGFDRHLTKPFDPQRLVDLVGES